MNDDTEIFEELLRCRQSGVPAALAIIVERSGSAPQGAGAKMLVKADGTGIGTVGGGQLEAEVIEAALGAIGSGEPRTLSVELTESNGYVCGGSVRVYIEPILTAPQLVVFGAGHVGRALSKAASFGGFGVTVVDDRADFADSAQLPEASRVIINSFTDPFAGIPVDGNTFVVIATRGHAHDLEVLQAALKTQAGYIGLLGSQRKRKAFFETLRKNEFSDNDIARVHTPVGVNIGAVTPNEIAVSITAELIQHRRTHGLPRRGAAPGSGPVKANGPAQTTAACPQ